MGASGKLRIGLVQHDGDAGRHQRLQLGVAEGVAGGVVGAGKQDQGSLVRDCGEHRVEIEGEVGLTLNLIELNAVNVAQEAVHAERRRADEHALTRSHEGPDREVDQFVGTSPRDDPIGVDVEVHGAKASRNARWEGSG